MNKKNILIVDDQYSFADFAKMVMETAGHEATICLEADEVLARALDERPDLILMDMNMPEVGGLQAIAILKSRPEIRDIPIVLCSATQNREDVEAALAAGAVDFVAKPLRSGQLQAAVAKILMERRGAEA